MNAKKRIVVVAAVLIGVLGIGSAVAVASINATAIDGASASPSETASPSTAPQPTPSPSSVLSAAPGAPEAWVIGMARIGPLVAGMSPEQIASEVGISDIEPWFANQFGEGCSIYRVGSSGSAAYTSAIAVSQGGRGPVDFFTVYAGAGSGQAAPSTAEGLTLGSSENSIVSVYGDQIMEAPFVYAERRLVIQDGDDAIVFDLDNGAVTSISTGSSAQIASFLECS